MKSIWGCVPRITFDSPFGLHVFLFEQCLCMVSRQLPLPVQRSLGVVGALIDRKTSEVHGGNVDPRGSFIHPILGSRSRSEQWSWCSARPGRQFCFLPPEPRCLPSPFYWISVFSHERSVGVWRFTQYFGYCPWKMHIPATSTQPSWTSSIFLKYIHYILDIMVWHT